MIITQDIALLRAQVSEWRKNGKTVAFVPTMGNLHQGHLTLVKEAQKRAHYVVVSIFVNPLQFGANEDLASYPKTLEADQTLLADQGTALLFTPNVETIYPKPLAKQTQINVPTISDTLCGASRPGHFTGVATIVCKLFNIVQPDLAFFGKKDFQQLLVIKTMVNDLSMPIDIIGVDTVREDSGLALSSRNGYLSEQEKLIAPALRAQLVHLIKAIQNDASIDISINDAKKTLTALGFTVDYIDVRSALTLMPPEKTDTSLVVLAAAKLGKARLIDNQEFQR